MRSGILTRMPEGPSDPDTATPVNDTRPAWSKLHLWQMQPIRDVLLGLGVVALFWLGQKTSIVTVPLLLAILLAYLFEPVIQFLMRRLKMSRPGAVIGIIVALVLVVGIPSVVGATYGVAQTVALGSSLVENTGSLNDALGKELAPPPRPAEGDMSDPQSDSTVPSIVASPRPRNLPTADEVREQLRSESGDAWVWIYDSIRRERGAQGTSSIAQALDAITKYVSEEGRAEQISQAAAGAVVETIRSLLGFALTLFSLAFTAFVTIFFFFFLATGWVQFKHFVEKLLPDKHKGRIVDLAVKFDAVIAGFIRGRLTIAFIQAIVFSLGYWAIGVPAAFILGPAVAILSIVPYLALVGLPVSIGLLWLEGHAGVRGEIWWVLGAPTALYFIGQSLDDYVWTPLIQGKQTGLDTPVILFASLAGGAVFGVFGLLIAIPIAACIKILIQEIVWPKFKDWAEGRAADPLPID